MVVPPDAPSVSITVRPATAADLQAIGRLGAELVRGHHALDQKRFMAASPGTASEYASFLGSQLTAKNAILLVAVCGGRAVGYTYSGVEGTDWMSLRGPAGVVHDIVVDPVHRGQGVGRQLLDETLRVLEERGVSQVVLLAAVLNEPARRLFARAGFRETMVEMTRDAGQVSGNDAA